MTWVPLPVEEMDSGEAAVSDRMGALSALSPNRRIGEAEAVTDKSSSAPRDVRRREVRLDMAKVGLSCEMEWEMFLRS